MTRSTRGGADTKPQTFLHRAQIRDALMVWLTVLTGATDAVAFTKLGGVFTSVMTGNMVLIGVAIGHGSLSKLADTALAFFSYIAGSLLGGKLVGHPRRDDPMWPVAMTLALLVELGLFVVFAVLWWGSSGDPSSAERAVMLATSASALGVQSSTVLRLGISGLSTTYLTGTLTTVVHGLAAGRGLRGNGRSLLILVALITGAALGGLTTAQLPGAAPLIPLVIVLSTAAVAARVFRRDVTDPDPVLSR